MRHEASASRISSVFLPPSQCAVLYARKPAEIMERVSTTSRVRGSSSHGVGVRQGVGIRRVGKITVWMVRVKMCFFLGGMEDAQSIYCTLSQSLTPFHLWLQSRNMQIKKITK